MGEATAFDGLPYGGPAAAVPDGVRPVVPAGGLLAVHAHPDDETLTSGALLATWAASGAPVTLVTCTRGERGEVIAAPGTPSEGLARLEGDGPALAAYREGELATALAALGVRDHLFLDEIWFDGAGGETRYEDSGMRWIAPGVAGAADDSGPTAFARVPLDEAAARLARVIADRRPAVVATYGPGGGYGHPDHVRAHDVSVRALEMVDGDRPQLWCHGVPEELFRERHRVLARLKTAGALPACAHDLALPDDEHGLPPVAVEAGALAGGVAVAVQPVLDRVLRALRSHATQVQCASTVPVGVAGSSEVLGCYALSNRILAPIPSHEFYATSVARLRPRHPMSAPHSTLGG